MTANILHIGGSKAGRPESCSCAATDRTWTAPRRWRSRLGHSRTDGPARFDYRGHGGSGSEFLDGNISSWTQDCLAAFDALTDGPQLVGSSLGNWLMLISRWRPGPRRRSDRHRRRDFTEDLLAEFDADQRREIEAEGVIALPNPYSDEPVRYPWH